MMPCFLCCEFVIWDNGYAFLLILLGINWRLFCRNAVTVRSDFLEFEAETIRINTDLNGFFFFGGVVMFTFSVLDLDVSFKRACR